MSNINDKFTKVKVGSNRPLPTFLTAQKANGATSMSLDDTTNWNTDTAVHGILYRTDASDNKIQSSQIDWKGVVSGNTITNLVITAGTDDVYEVGSVVELAPTAQWGEDIVDGLEVSHNQDGTLKNGIVIEDKIGDGEVTPAKRSGGFDAGLIDINSTSNGDLSITSLDFRPKRIRFSYVRHLEDVNGADTSTASGGFANGVAVDTNGDGAIDKQFSMQTANRCSGDSLTSVFNNKCIAFRIVASGGVVGSFFVDASAVETLSNGFKLNFANTDGGFVLWEAEA